MTVWQFPDVQPKTHFVGALHVMSQFPPEKRLEFILYLLQEQKPLIRVLVLALICRFDAANKQLRLFRLTY